MLTFGPVSISMSTVINIIKILLYAVIVLLWGIVFYRVLFQNRLNYSFRERRKLKKTLTTMHGIKQQSELKAIRVNALPNKVKKFKALKVFTYTLKRKEMYNFYIIRLGMLKEDKHTKYEPDELYILDCYTALPFLVAGLILVWFKFIFSILFLVALFAYNIRNMIRRIKINDLKKEIEKQLPDFLRSFYYNFRTPKDTFRLDIFIKDYMSLANPAMSNMLSKLSVDLLDLGDIAALNQLEDNYRDIELVYRFGKVAEAIRQKEENAQLSLEALISNLNIMIDRRLEKERIRKEEKIQHEIEKIFYVIMILAFTFITVTCFSQIS